MAIRIHHTQIKQAAKLGITLEVGENGNAIVARKNGNAFVAANAKDAIAAALKDSTTADVMATLKAAPKTKKPRKAKAPKFTCESCGSHRKPVASDDGEEDVELVCAECGEMVLDAEQGGSVVKQKYKLRYKPNKGKCGDDLSFTLSEHVTYEDEETGKPKVDMVALRTFAEANGVWVKAYGSMHPGLARMNVSNRLRAKVRRAAKTKEKFEIDWTA